MIHVYIDFFNLNICFVFCRRDKEMIKAHETPEEKRARRLAKKVWLIVNFQHGCVGISVSSSIFYVFFFLQNTQIGENN